MREDEIVPKIMIVDDDKTTVALLQMLLELDGFSITQVARGAEVMDKARVELPDAFLIDFHLSDNTSGDQIIAELRSDSHFAAAPIIAVSGMNVEDKALKAGANHFLLKPFDPGQLPKLFSQLIGK